jgi:AsmA protein
MVKLIKFLLGTTVLIVLLFGVVVLAAVMYFDPNDHKDRIIAKVEEETGRQLKLEGDINLSYYPWLGLEVSGVTLGNAEGFGDAPFIHADVVALRIKTMPLLKKQYELDTLKLHGVEINLAKNKEGVSNWDDLVHEEKGDSKKQEPIKLAAVILGGVDIKGTRFSWDDQGTGQTFRITEMNMSTGELIFGEPIDIKMDLKAESNQPAIKADMDMQGTASYDLDAEIYAFSPIGVTAKLTGKNIPGGKAELKFNTGVAFNLKEDTASIDNLTLSGLGAHVKAQLNASNIKSGQPITEGQLSVTGDDIARLFKVAGIEPLASQLAKLKDRSFDLQTSLNADMGKGNVAISDLKANLIGASISGQVEASSVESDTPAVKGKLKASGPDLPTLLQVAGQFEGGKDPKLKVLGEKLSKASNKKFEVNTEFDADLASGNINVPALSIKTLGVTVDGHLQATDINSNKGNIDGKLSLQGEKLSSVLAALGQHGLAKNLRTISVDVGVKGNRSDIKMSPLKAEAIFSGKQIPNSPAKVSLNADTLINLDKQTISISKMAVTGLGLDVKGDMNVSQFLSEAPGVKGKLDAKGKDLGLIFKLLGNDPLAKQINKLKNKSFSVKTDFNADMATGKLDVSALNASMLDATIKGQFAAENIQTSTPAISGELTATGPDLPTLLQIAGQFEGGDDPMLAEYGKRLSKAPKKNFNVAAKFNADMKKGNINLPSLSAKGLGLTLGGKMVATNFNSKNGQIDGQLALKGEDLSAILIAFDQGALAGVLKKISVDIGVKGNSSDINLSPLNIKATVAGKDIPNSPVDLTMSANTKMNLDKQTLSVNNMKLNGLGLDLKANINATQIKDQPAFTGDVAISEFNLRQFMMQMKQEVPVTADKKVLTKVALKTKFSGSGTSLELKDLVLLLDDTNLKGNLAVKHFTQPRFDFGIGIDNINADRYLPPLVKAAKSKPGKDGAAEQKTVATTTATDLPLNTLRKLNGKGNLLIGKLIYSNLRLRNIKLGVNARDGLVKLDPIAADLYQGKYNGIITLDARGKLAELKQETQLSGVQIEPLLKDYTQSAKSQLAGAANITAKVSSKGSNTLQLKHSLSGEAKLAVTDGILRGIDVRKTLEQAEIILESKRPGTVKQGGETRFEQLTGTLNIKNGVIKNNDLLITAPGFKVNGGVNKKDTLGNLRNNSIKYDLSVAVVEDSATRGSDNYNIGGYAIPISCRGSLDDLAGACQPDYGKLLGVALQKGALEKLGESIGIDLSGQKQSAPETTTKTTRPPATDTSQQPKSEPKSVEEAILESVLDSLPF